MHSKRLSYGANRVFDFLVLWILPIGLLLLLSSLFFVTNRNVLHKFYYGLFSAPTLLLLCLRPREIKELLREPLVIAFLVFCAWALTSLLWSPEQHPDTDLFKRPLHTFMLFAGCGLLLHYRNELFKPIFFSAAVIALVVCLFNLVAFIKGFEPGMRMIGGRGALDNPLLSSHVFGFFCVYWLYVCVTTQRLHVLWFSVPAMAIMTAAVLATGSRTPLVALTLTILWITFVSRNRRSALLIAGLVVGAAGLLLIYPELITSRGSSFRFELWSMSLQRIADHPWIGHSYDSELYLTLADGNELREPHSFALGVLYYVGIIGFIPWIFMLAWGLFKGFKQRAQPLFILASSLLMYGIGAGLTEGGGILSRPKEHWFLLWIPLAIIAGLSVAQRRRSVLSMPVQSLKTETFEQLCSDAHVIEADGLGPKVLRLADGRFLKVFRPRRWYTSGSFNPYSERFASNAEQLRAMGIPTPQILGVYGLSDGSSAVIYSPLSGLTLRQALQSLDSSLRESLIERFGQFMAQLHERGVYFRSLHQGNVLLMDDGEFGLIDIADLRIFPSPLRNALRQRNLRHMQRYPQDRAWLFETHFEQLAKGYASVAGQAATATIRAHVLKLASPAA
ncbi:MULTISPECIES: bifunctional O-antigen ligase/aminoglycoside phosphotransferase family protein [Pseudomonas]|jgi:O-antigen ligase/tRNA A-37 threonylcarbamoyl transferase component Bud32|uniref:bifunctional O-antigen ligase/aminoglycoside phosphotransferase family protein n=1 Tax=Pseudomonas TaxID=286 RepID=UPI00064C0B40|nr:MULTISPECIES: bifunctional O-antigen ligase/aminoglycoside phosphotransferase family protein [Pseudomonas]MBX4136973.1 O-antigen ligase family protein [Pseudomonas sp. S5F11]MDN6863371.1 O-antigen ligase family protein [Pseudomonas rhodesiae]PHN29201.1 polymerase [Pseudomonas sp. ICMP 564]QVN07711.1 O-antigen ligase family protein [Pseudomonas rhodesiae]